MITIDVIESCPYTKAGQGVIKIAHPVLAIIAGAVYDRNEWIALLIGKRSENGLDITVTDIKVPQQERGYASCELANPEPLTEDIIGVIHSHHSMGAFFSKTDHDELNPRFPMSLVVAQVKQNQGLERLLGFSYKAEGRVVLPCHNPGVVDFTVLPDPLIPEWPTVTSGFSVPTTTDPCDCPYTTRENKGMTCHTEMACGLTSTEAAHSIFGHDGKQFLAEVQAKTTHPKFTGWSGYKGKNNNCYPGMPVVDNRRYWKNGRETGGPFIDGEEYDERYLRHWGV